MNGPVPQAFTVYKDFMSYHSGVYNVADRTKVGAHSTTIIGWNGNALISVNSWGQGWGERGLFKMVHGCCNNRYYIPEQLYSSQQSAVPLPPTRRRRTGQC